MGDAFRREGEWIRAHSTRWALWLDPGLSRIEPTGTVFSVELPHVRLGTRWKIEVAVSTNTFGSSPNSLRDDEPPRVNPGSRVARRHEFADHWYDLHNPDPSTTAVTVRFETRRDDFPPHFEDLRIEDLLLSFTRTDGADFEVPVEGLRFSDAAGGTLDAGAAQTVDGVISTRRANGLRWTTLRDRPPVGEWELTVPNTTEVREHFDNEQFEDVLFVIAFRAKTPERPL